MYSNDHFIMNKVKTATNHMNCVIYFYGALNNARWFKKQKIRPTLLHNNF